MKPVMKLSIILSIIFFVGLIYFVINYYKRDSLANSYDYLLEEQADPDVSKYLALALKQMITYEGMPADSIWVQDENKNVLLDEYTKDSTLFILFYPQHFCGECFSGDMIRYNDLSTEYKGRTMLLSTKLNRRDLHFFKKEHDITSEMYHIQTSLNGLFQEMHEPCFFLLDKDMKVRLFFNPDPEQPEMSDWYFDKIRRVLKAG